ncbi:hypothetical protein CDV31_001721 [Fusarium ambrosium]|uniref:Uncharacterized protein n=1 Tax=Fusarium ambrosium TaxID=131363 RepID=A0A428UZ49_9HYPO|nr:hypothetical protein CDV31_001721 [Fusarium ambrosium]
MEAIGVVAIAQARCQQILTTMDRIGLRRTKRPVDRIMYLMVEQWMKSLQDVRNVLQDSNLPPHERLLFIRILEEINNRLNNLRKLFTSFLSKNQRSAIPIRPQKLQDVSRDADSIMQSIDNSFSLVHRFLQTANDLQPLRERISHTTSDLWRLREPHIQTIDNPQLRQGFFEELSWARGGLQDEIRIDEIGEQAFRFPDQMVFEDGQNFVLSLRGTSQDTTSVDKLFQQKDGHEGLQKWLQELQGIPHGLENVNIVVCGQPTDQGAVTMKDEAVLLDVLKTLKVPFTSVHRLLDVILCELLTAGDIASVRGTANQLQEVESRTRWSGVFDNVMDVEHANEGARVSFSQMTRTLNVAISRLPTREARTKANVLLVERILECISAIVKKHCEGDNARMNEALLKSTNRLKQRLQVLQATQNGLLLEIARETQIASSQLQIVYNLVAQRDNKNNYEMARISLEISRTAKDDSFAMFTLAVMSILFLPGAFIATLFSMDLFDWSAKDGERVINSRFWTYWAIALPLTLIVLIGWLSWLKMHQKNEDRKQKIVPMAASQQTHLSCPNPRHSDVSQCRNETAAHATTSAIEDADVGSGRQSWKVYSRRKASRASSLSPGIVPDVEMNDKDDEPSRAAVEPAVLVTTEVPSARSLKQGSMEEAMKRSYTFAAQGLRRD